MFAPLLCVLAAVAFQPPPTETSPTPALQDAVPRRIEPVGPQPPFGAPGNGRGMQGGMMPGRMGGPGGMPGMGGGAEPAFATGVFPLGATMVSSDGNGNLSIDTLATKLVPQTATRTIPVQGPDGRTQYRSEQYTLMAPVFETSRRPLPPATRIFRNGRELSAEEKRGIRYRTPIFIAVMAPGNGPPGRGFEALIGDNLVAYIPRESMSAPPGPAMTAPQSAPSPVQGGVMPRTTMSRPSPPTAGRSASPTPSANASPTEKEILDKVNEARAAAGLPALKLDARLSKAAEQHSANMAKQGRLDHFLDRKGPRERITEQGLEPTFTGENCAQGQQSGAQAMESWLSSQGHRQNILNPNFTHIGVGKADGQNGPFWTQVFARIEQGGQ